MPAASAICGKPKSPATIRTVQLDNRLTFPLAVGVIGCGRMGRLHARVCSQIQRIKLAGVYDSNPESAAAVAEQFSAKSFDSLDALLSNVSAVVIAAPTSHHLEIARQCIERGVACLIEKPLAADSRSARQIVELARARGVCVQVGHIERFNPAVRAMGNLEIKPRFIEVIRISPLTFRSIDVGVVLDMMIHDIDIVLRLAASPVTRVDAVGVSVIEAGAPEDICNARLTFESGCVANLTASRLSLKTERKLRIFSPNCYVTLDYQKKYAMVARRGENLKAIRDAVGRLRAGEVKDLSELNFSELVNVEELEIDDVEPLRAEWESFADSVVSGELPAVTAEEGLAAVEVAERIVGAMKPESL
jgi:predicted dehydrogenase